MTTTKCIIDSLLERKRNILLDLKNQKLDLKEEKRSIHKSTDDGLVAPANAVKIEKLLMELDTLKIQNQIYMEKSQKADKLQVEVDVYKKELDLTSLQLAKMMVKCQYYGELRLALPSLKEKKIRL